MKDFTETNPMKKTVSNDDGNGNLADNKIDTNIKPITDGNRVSITICALVCSLSLCGGRADRDLIY
jgi:hypothetical protein